MRVRGQVTFQGGTNVPEDRFVNTFHFDNAGWANLDAAADAIHPALTGFYLNPVAGDSIGKALSQFIVRAASIRYYDLAQAEPRVPDIRTFTLPTAHAGVALPEEVAVVASFHGSPPVTPRRRGRVYLGPVGPYAEDSTTATTPSRVIGGMRTLVCDRMEELALAGVGWCIYSPTSDAMVPVAGGYCDNAFDTQRRRGPKTTARTVWNLLP